MNYCYELSRSSTKIRNDFLTMLKRLEIFEWFIFLDNFSFCIAITLERLCSTGEGVHYYVYGGDGGHQSTKDFQYYRGIPSVL